MAVWIAPHHAQYPSPSGPSPLHQSAGIGGIGPDQLEPGEPAQQLAQHQLGAVPVPVSWHGAGSGCWPHVPLRPRAGRWYPRRIHYDVAFAPRYLLAGVVAPRPPFSVVFTDWLSMMAALGVASRPSLSRTWLRSASSTRSQVPSARHFRKYHHTVPQGGRSWGTIRHGMPPRKTYSMPFTTSCKSTARRRPLADAGGNKASKCSHWDSVRSLGFAFRFIPPIYSPQFTGYSPSSTKLSQHDFSTILTHPLRERAGQPGRAAKGPNQASCDSPGAAGRKACRFVRRVIRCG